MKKTLSIFEGGYINQRLGGSHWHEEEGVKLLQKFLESNMKSWKSDWCHLIKDFDIKMYDDKGNVKRTLEGDVKTRQVDAAVLTQGCIILIELKDMPAVQGSNEGAWTRIKDGNQLYIDEDAKGDKKNPFEQMQFTRSVMNSWLRRKDVIVANGYGGKKLDKFYDYLRSVLYFTLKDDVADDKILINTGNAQHLRAPWFYHVREGKESGLNVINEIVHGSRNDSVFTEEVAIEIEKKLRSEHIDTIIIEVDDKNLNSRSEENTRLRESIEPCFKEVSLENQKKDDEHCHDESVVDKGKPETPLGDESELVVKTCKQKVETDKTARASKAKRIAKTNLPAFEQTKISEVRVAIVCAVVGAMVDNPEWISLRSATACWKKVTGCTIEEFIGSSLESIAYTPLGDRYFEWEPPKTSTSYPKIKLKHVSKQNSVTAKVMRRIKIATKDVEPEDINFTDLAEINKVALLSVYVAYASLLKKDKETKKSRKGK